MSSNCCSLFHHSHAVTSNKRTLTEKIGFFSAFFISGLFVFLFRFFRGFFVCFLFLFCCCCCCCCCCCLFVCLLFFLLLLFCFVFSGGGGGGTFSNTSIFRPTYREARQEDDSYFDSVRKLEVVRTRPSSSSPCSLHVLTVQVLCGVFL